jgi:hypothetical protein
MMDVIGLIAISFGARTSCMDTLRKGKKGSFSLYILDFESDSLLPVLYLWLAKRGFCNYSWSDDFLLYLYMEFENQGNMDKNV